MTDAKKFCVVKLYKAPESGRSPYKVVPTFWIKNENNNVTVPYPPEEKLAQNFDRIFDCQLPLAEWEDYNVVIEREADTYQAGILYVKRRSSTLLTEETLLVWKQISLEWCLDPMAIPSPLAILRSSDEQNQTSQSSSFSFVNIDLEKMTDSGPSNQPGRSPKNKKNAVSKFFNRLNLSKKQLDESNTPLLEEQGTSKERSTTMTNVNSSYGSVAHPDLSSESYCATPHNSPTTSRDVPPDQSLQAKQYRLLRRLQSTLSEANAIVEEFLVLYKRDD